MIKQIYLILMSTIGLSGCAISYKYPIIHPQTKTLTNFPDSLKNSILINKSIDSTILFNNTRIKKKLLRKGYQVFLITINNYTNDSLDITPKNLFVIKDYAPIAYVKKEEVMEIIRLNRGIFYTLIAYGLINPLQLRGGEFHFATRGLYLALPLVAYGIVNNIIAYQSAKNLKKAINNYYIIGKSVAPNQNVSGIIIIKSLDDKMDFTLKTIP